MDIASPDNVDATVPDGESVEGSTTMPRRRPGEAVTLRDAWRRHAAEWITWSRAPMHDSYWRFHRDQFLSLLPGPSELTLDIGAGEGRLTRDLRRRGHRVIAVDAAPTLAAAARDADPTTAFVVADAAALPLADGIADLAVAFMTLHDFDDLHAAIREVARVLKPGGCFCAAIVHPLNSAGNFDGDDPDAHFRIDGAYLQPSLYRDQASRGGLSMTFVSAHRPLQDHAKALSDAGFLIQQIREPAVPEWAIRSDADRRWQRLPLFLHLRAVRTPITGTGI